MVFSSDRAFVHRLFTLQRITLIYREPMNLKIGNHVPDFLTELVKTGSHQDLPKSSDRSVFHWPRTYISKNSASLTVSEVFENIIDSHFLLFLSVLQNLTFLILDIFNPLVNKDLQFFLFGGVPLKLNQCLLLFFKQRF